LEEKLELLINLPDKKKIDKEIEEKTKSRIRSQQDEYYLREKLKAIKKKLGELGEKSGSGETQEWLEKLEKEPYPEYVKKVVREETRRYERIPVYSSEANIIRQYIDCLISLP